MVMTIYLYGSTADTIVGYDAQRYAFRNRHLAKGRPEQNESL